MLARMGSSRWRDDYFGVMWVGECVGRSGQDHRHSRSLRRIVDWQQPYVVRLVESHLAARGRDDAAGPGATTTGQLTRAFIW